MEELKIGVLRVEKLDKETGKIVLTVSEDADCVRAAASGGDRVQL